MNVDPAARPDGFWPFSLRVYGKPGVASACIELQDELGLDVNMLLFCLFAGSRGQLLTVQACAALDADVAAWRENVVHGLRAVRRWLKAQPAAALRQEVLQLELNAERQQQQMMEAALPIGTAPADARISALNLRCYLDAVKCRLPDSQVHLLAVVWNAAHPGAEPGAFSALGM